MIGGNNMVCKECGAYNADELSSCRVCGARLKDAEARTGRPEKNFVKAPAYSGKAYASDSSAALKDAQQAARKRAEQLKEKADEAVHAEEKKQDEKEDSSEKRFCSSCGKPLFADAPFCPYCGAKNVLALTEDAEDASDFDTEEEVEEEIEVAEEKPIRKTIFHKNASFDEDDEDDEEEYEDEFDDDEDDEEDEDEFDDEYYDDEFDDDDEEPRKGKGSTILFIVLILILLALIAFFARYFLKKNPGMLSGIFGNKGAVDVVAENTPEPVDYIEDEPVTADNMTASIKEDVIDGTEIYEINVKAPTGSVVRIISNANLERDSVTIERDDTISLRVPRVVFLPGDYCETASVTVTPQLEVTLPDQSVRMLSVPAVNLVVPQVKLEMTSPNGTSVEAPANDRPITVSGVVSDHTVQVTVNGANVQVFEGGTFTYDYYPKNVEGETIEVVAKKIDYMNAVCTIEVTPFVIKDMQLTINNDMKGLRAVDGKVNVTGNCPDDANITASAADNDIMCGPVTVENGQFSCLIAIPKEGYYNITFDATAEGYNDASVSCMVEAEPTLSYSRYANKAYDLNKNYNKIGSAKDVTSVLFRGTVSEIIQTEPYTVFTLKKGDKIVYVANRSTKNVIGTDDIGKTKTVAGYYCHEYPDTDKPYVWGWYIVNK